MVSAWTSSPSLMACGLIFATCSTRTLEVLPFGLFIVLAGVARLRSPANYSCHLHNLAEFQSFQAAAPAFWSAAGNAAFGPTLWQLVNCGDEPFPPRNRNVSAYRAGGKSTRFPVCA